MAEFLRTKLKPLDKATQSLTSEFLNIKKDKRNNPKDNWIEGCYQWMLGQPLPNLDYSHLEFGCPFIP